MNSFSQGGVERLSRWQNMEIDNGKLVSAVPSIFDENGVVLPDLTVEELNIHIYCIMELQLRLDEERFEILRGKNP